MTILRAKAKVNLFFHINGQRADGYHLIESLLVFAQDVYDTIKITPAIKASSSGAKIENNIIDKVLDIFDNPPYHYELTKSIPIGAGLGGGSSDAAMVAKFLNKNDQDINDALIKIGADLPVCYYAEAAYCSNIGEVIEPVKNLPKLYLLLVNPNKSLLTALVFKENKVTNTPRIVDKPLDFYNDVNRMIAFLEPLKNDLSAAAIKLMPEIQNILDLLKNQKGCKIYRMSGSGPTCFGIFTDQKLAELAKENILGVLPSYWVEISKI